MLPHDSPQHIQVYYMYIQDYIMLYVQYNDKSMFSNRSLKLNINAQFLKLWRTSQ